MSAQTDKFYDIIHFVKPYQQEITLDVAFHATLVLTFKHMWLIVDRNGLFVLKQIKNFLQSF